MIRTEKLTIQTRGNGESVEFTDQVRQTVSGSGVSDGTVTVFVTGSTAGLTTIEYEPGVVSDFSDMFERVAPQGMKYAHDRAWGDGNGHAHVRASLLGPSLVIPFSGGKLLLGAWQQIILVDFDNRARTRQIILQMMGE